MRALGLWLGLIRPKQTGSSPGTVSNLLIETGFNLLLEDGYILILEP